ncbi:MAG TPA: hypothetical protein VFM15_09430 [Gammaproteobacteria bacterium]|nr:hypothetical protein [Gammaproteobacteria bacterium]
MTETARDVRLHDPEADARMVATASLWHYFPSILSYPLRGYAVGVVIVIGFMFWLFDLAGIFSIAMAPIVLSWLTVYLFMIVEDTAQGHAVAPPLGTEVLGHGGYGRMVLVIAFWGLCAWLGVALEHRGIAQGMHLVMLAGMLIFPAFLVCMALEDSLLEALNPWRWLRFMYLTGGVYLLAASLLGIAYVALATLSGAVSSLLAHMIVVYFLVMSAHMLGFITYHRHERLGLDVSVARPTEERARMAEQQRVLERVLNRACTLNEAGDWDAACALLRREQDDLCDPRLYHEELYEGLRLRRQRELALIEAKQLVRWLVAQKRLGRALDICVECLDVNRRFELEPLGNYVVLAEAAFDARRWDLFEKFINDVPLRHPGTPQAASLQFLQARRLAEFEKRDAEALALLKPLLADAEHPWAARIRALHQALSGLAK